MPFANPNTTSIPGLFTYANSVTGDMLFTLLLLAVFVILFGARFRTEEFEQNLMSASLVTAIISYLLWIPGLVSELVIIFFTILTVVSVAMKKMK